LNTFAIQLTKTYLPYLVAFLLGVLVMWRGCGGSGKKETVTIDKPVPTIEYVERWKTDTVRFVNVVIKKDVVRDTVSNTITDVRTDTIFNVDTISVVDAWLTELVKYDTTVTLSGVNVALKWQNYQNLSEKLSIGVSQVESKKKGLSLGVHGNAGMISDFKESYRPLMGLGLQVTIKKTYVAADYGFNGDHFIGVRVGRNIVNL